MTGGFVQLDGQLLNHSLVFVPGPEQQGRIGGVSGMIPLNRLLY